MVLGDVEETITVVDVDEDTLKEVIRVGISQSVSQGFMSVYRNYRIRHAQLDFVDSTGN